VSFPTNPLQQLCLKVTRSEDKDLSYPQATPPNNQDSKAGRQGKFCYVIGMLNLQARALTVLTLREGLLPKLERQVAIPYFRVKSLTQISGFEPHREKSLVLGFEL
jgi:hypothetical protein